MHLTFFAQRPLLLVERLVNLIVCSILTFFFSVVTSAHFKESLSLDMKQQALYYRCLERYQQIQLNRFFEST